MLAIQLSAQVIPAKFDDQIDPINDRRCCALLTSAHSAPAAPALLSSCPSHIMPEVVQLSSTKAHGGTVSTWSHVSETLGGLEAKFSLYVPVDSAPDKSLPVLLWLSGLTCTHENALAKADLARAAADAQVILVCPDTSPRGDAVADVEARWDVGKGAGYYCNATAQPWAAHYQMFSYVTSEVLSVAQQAAPASADFSRLGVAGHSMGGLGALLCGLKCPEKFCYVGALAPIASPSACPWGERAFGLYFGEDREAWAAWDPARILPGYAGPARTLWIDQGTADQFYKDGQLRCEDLKDTEKVKVIAELHEGYDHSLSFFVATFAPLHIARFATAAAGAAE